MFHHHVTRLQGRVLHRAGYVVRAACLQGCLVNHIDGEDGGLHRLGMGVEHHRIPRRNHADGIADHGLAWIGAGCDGADNTERAHLNEGQTSVP